MRYRSWGISTSIFLPGDISWARPNECSGGLHGPGPGFAARGPVPGNVAELSLYRRPAGTLVLDVRRPPGDKIFI